MHSSQECRANTASTKPLSAHGLSAASSQRRTRSSLARFPERDALHFTGATQISAPSLLVARPRAMASALRAFFDMAAA